MLRDLGSTNGVFLNGLRVRQAPLKLRDVLRIGDFVGVLVAVCGDDSAAPPFTFEEMRPGYWAGPGLQAALQPARLVAGTDLPIIIQGETGTGKEGAAQTIAAWSGRPGPVVAVNCAALPDALAEGELFGYRRGAFSGAERAHLGFLRAADGGTLLLDEVAELSLPVQAKLLRAVEQREVVPLGQTEAIPVDVRFLAAAQSPLRQAVDEKRFRGDLLARLDGLTVVLPPLRARIEEVPQLFARLLELHQRGAPAPRLDPLLVERLCVHDWPFNVRELALLARRLLALHPGAPVLERGMLEIAPPPSGGEPGPAVATRDAAVEPASEIPEPAAATILCELRAARGNVKRAAAALGISRGRLYRLMDKVEALDLAVIRQPG